MFMFEVVFESRVLRYLVVSCDLYEFRSPRGPLGDDIWMSEKGFENRQAAIEYAKELTIDRPVVARVIDINPPSKKKEVSKTKAAPKPRPVEPKSKTSSSNPNINS